MKKNPRIQQKYYNFLVDLKTRLDRGDKFSVTQFSQSRKINRAIFQYLVKFGYVKKDGRNYKWIGVDPSIRLVNRIRKEHSINCQAYQKKQNATKIVVNTLKPRVKPEQIAVKGATEIKVVNPKVIYTKVFFGLFTLKSTIEY